MIVQNKKKIVISLVLVTALFLAFNVSVSTGASWKDRLLNRFKPAVPPEALLPPDVTVKPGFAVGVGKPIGEVQKADGTVYVVHKGQDVAGAGRVLRKMAVIFEKSMYIAPHYTKRKI